jgi:cytidylate kinase
MPTVTIRGQLGSGAPEIGKLIADKLHTDYVDREIIARVAELLNTQKQDVIAKEMPQGSFLGRIAEALGRGYAISGDYGGAYMPVTDLPLDDTRYLAGLAAVIKELARSDSIVIRGRGSQFILKDHPGALHIFVVAPLELRVRRVMEGLKLDETAAMKEITDFDRSRSEFVKRYFHALLEDPVNYDLVVNTGHLSFEAAVSIVAAAVAVKDTGQSTQ